MDRRRVRHRGQRGDDRIGDRDRAGEGVAQRAALSARPRAAGLLLTGRCGLGTHLRDRARIRGQVHRAAAFDQHAGGHGDRRRRGRLRVPDAEERRAAGLADALGCCRRIDAYDVVGQQSAVRAERDPRLGGLHQDLDRQRAQVVEEAQRRVGEEVRFERGEAERVGEWPVFGLGDQVDVRRRQRRPRPDVDVHGLAEEAGREQVLELGRGHAAGAEHDVVRQAGCARDAGGQRRAGADDDAVGERFEITAAGEHVPLEPHRVPRRVRFQRRRAALIAVEQQVGGEQRIDRPDDDRVGPEQPADGQRVGRVDELECAGRHRQGADEVQPLEPDARVARRGSRFQDDRLAEDGAADVDVVRVAAVERVEVVHSGIENRLAVDRGGPGFVDGRGVERGVGAGGLVDREGVRRARAAADGAAHAAARLESERIAGDQGGTGQILEAGEARALHRAGVRAGDAPGHLRVFGAVQRVDPAAADDGIDRRELAHAGGGGRRQVHVHRAALGRIVERVGGGPGTAVVVVAAVDRIDRTAGRDPEEVVAAFPDQGFHSGERPAVQRPLAGSTHDPDIRHVRPEQGIRAATRPAVDDASDGATRDYEEDVVGIAAAEVLDSLELDHRAGFGGRRPRADAADDPLGRGIRPTQRVRARTAHELNVPADRGHAGVDREVHVEPGSVDEHAGGDGAEGFGGEHLRRDRGVDDLQVRPVQQQGQRGVVDRRVHQVGGRDAVFQRLHAKRTAAPGGLPDGLTLGGREQLANPGTHGHGICPLGACEIQKHGRGVRGLRRRSALASFNSDCDADAPSEGTGSVRR